jgi:hypothetical protein
MLDFIFDLPLAVAGVGIIVFLCLFAVIGLLLVRRHLLPRLRVKGEDSEFSGAMVQAIMVFYGLAVALIAVSVWQTYSDVSKIISQEASRVAGLYRDVNAYPEPVRSRLQQELKGYLDYVIHQAWPLQQKGKVAMGGVAWMTRFQETLTAFEPVTEGQKLLHGETLRAYNYLIEARRLRLDATLTRLPGMLWFVIIVGAFISLSSSFFFKVEDVRLHGILVVLLSTFIGLVIFMIFALDRPFHGELGLGPEPYQLLIDQLMVH